MSDRARLDAIVAAITPLDEVEAAHVDDARAWVNSDSPLYRVAKPAEPPKHLVAYVVLVDLAQRAVLLVDHRNARRWLPPGGHVEPGEDPLSTAHRELREELGITAALMPGIASNPLFVTVAETVGPAPHIDVSLWYVLQASTATPLHPDAREFAAVRWWTFDEIDGASANTPFDPHFRRFAAKLGHAIAPASPPHT